MYQQATALVPVTFSGIHWFISTITVTTIDRVLLFISLGKIQESRALLRLLCALLLYRAQRLVWVGAHALTALMQELRVVWNKCSRHSECIAHWCPVPDAARTGFLQKGGLLGEKLALAEEREGSWDAWLTQ